MATSGTSADLAPGSPHWWVARLGERLMDRQSLYDLRESYAEGNHPLPNGDRRYVKALADFQNKAVTNYIALIQAAVTQKIRQKDFLIGDEGKVDRDARKIWQLSDMDIQAPVLIQLAAKLGFSYAIVLPPEEPGLPPQIFHRDPRNCEIERDRNRPTKTLAGLEFWVDEAANQAFAILYLPEVVYYFETDVPTRESIHETLSHGMSQSVGLFEIVASQPNPVGVVPLERCDWVPSAGERGLAAGEMVWSIQDRINKTTLERIVITNSQAYKQRWVTGAPVPKNGKNVSKRPPWEPGADILWLSVSPDTKFGEFSEANITTVLAAVRDDVGDMAAIEQTPVTSLVNNMVNVSGDTIREANSGHYAKVRLHQDAVGFFFERLMKIAFRYLGDPRATEVAQTLWWPIQAPDLASVADAFQKFVASGVPLRLAMEQAGIFTDEQIEFAVLEAERVKAETEAREDKQLAEQAAATEALSDSASETSA